ncbi:MULTISPECIES: hypothetical protein [unclassified Streptomyces]|uniref:hypothetical protein n=1 Tax=unclassified Streptomyces TaxID=2593676 RepID=UPI00081F5477|nr:MULTISPECIES: hypothetical protein [unclassified Streptomyces]MYR29867.1 hypothetical protein [Streptomyces sp. SID4945]SCF47921.1 hypothetical protein GA0115257_119419 [Streptomyces sp. LcepLS]
MDLTDVEHRAQGIADQAHDPEAAHLAEDTLLVDVLTEIATTSTDQRARALARAALATQDHERERWYA